MLPLFYGALLVGAWLLYRDIAGRSLTLFTGLAGIIVEPIETSPNG
jgi:hypothetical protein